MDRVLLAYKEGRPLTKEENRLNNKDSMVVFAILSVIVIGLGAWNHTVMTK